MACKIRGLMVTVCPSQFATRRTLFHVLVGCGLLMLKVSRLKLPVIWLLVSMWLNTLTKSQIWTLVLWLKLVKDFLKVRCRLALLPFLISCLIWLDLVASLPLIKERILVIILLLHFLSLMLGSVL